MTNFVSNSNGVNFNKNHCEIFKTNYIVSNSNGVNFNDIRTMTAIADRLFQTPTE